MSPPRHQAQEQVRLRRGARACTRRAGPAARSRSSPAATSTGSSSAAAGRTRWPAPTGAGAASPMGRPLVQLPPRRASPRCFDQLVHDGTVGPQRRGSTSTGCPASRRSSPPTPPDRWSAAPRAIRGGPQPPRLAPGPVRAAPRRDRRAAAGPTSDLRGPDIDHRPDPHQRRRQGR